MSTQSTILRLQAGGTRRRVWLVGQGARLFACGVSRSRKEDRVGVRANARVLIEAPSRFTAAYDRAARLKTHKIIPGLRERALVEQSEIRADIFRRGDEGEWKPMSSCLSRDDELVLASAGMVVPVAEISR